jgi:hypothetical protein
VGKGKKERKEIEKSKIIAHSLNHVTEEDKQKEGLR